MRFNRVKKGRITLFVLGFVLACCLLVPKILQASGHDVLKAAGCKTEYFLLYDLAHAYKNMSGHSIQLGKIGNRRAIELLMEERIDFAFTCKPIARLAQKMNISTEMVEGWKSIPVAKDPIVVVANRSNGVRNLTLAQLTDVFQGKIKNWQELGGNDLPIHPSFMDPKLESGVLLLFQEFLVNNDRLARDARITRGPSVSGNFVARTPGAITFMGYNSYREKYGQIIAIDNVAPTRTNIMNGNYGLCATYYITVNDTEKKYVSDFIDFCFSTPGRKTIEMNFIPYSE